MHSHHHHFFRHAAGRDMARDGRGSFGPGARGRRRRMFDSSEFRLVLLKLIEEQPRHGYDLIREIEARSGGGYTPSPGVIYPTLTLLLDMELAVESSDDRSRKVFAATDAGRAHLLDRSSEVAVAFRRLEALAEIRERTEAAPVQRAMKNLKSALQDRLSTQSVDRTVILEVASLIDDAAGRIERL